MQARRIAAGGLIVNIATAWLLAGGGGDHHGHAHGHEGATRICATGLCFWRYLGMACRRFRMRREDNLEPASVLGGRAASIETERPGGAR